MASINTASFYYRTRNDKEIDFVTRIGSKVEQLIQVCYDMSSGRTRKRELDALVEAAEELRCNNCVVITKDYNEQADWNGNQINIVEVGKF